MIDLGISKMALIGVVALIVIGPEKLPKVARTVGALLGKAQRYVADVKAEVNRSMELDALRQMKESMETAVRDVHTSVQSEVSELESSWNSDPSDHTIAADPGYPSYRRPRKNWRIKQTATPQWYKLSNGVRRKALSGAARVARYRPRR